MTAALGIGFGDAVALALLVATPAVALVLACVSWISPRVGSGGRLAAAAALPAIAAGFLVPAGTSIELPWLLAGSEIGIDAVGRLFLITAGVIWAAAAVYASATLGGGVRERAEFFGFLLLAMSGNFGLAIARDMLVFYLGFTLMSVAAWGMIVHSRRPRARAAGRVYMTLVICGDMLIFAALAIVARATAGELGFAAARAALAEAPGRHAAVALLVLGFGVKIGLIGVHVALPLIYRHAPVAAAAALAGPVINAGLLGLIRLLPLGEPGFATAGSVLIGCGLAGSFAGALAGAAQREPRTVLAYSSISQMGVMLLGIGVALREPSQAPALIMAVAVYAMHHAFTKSALFLGIGVAAARGARRRARTLVAAGLVLPSLALVAAPLTGGMLAKGLLDDAISAAGAGGLAALLPWTAVATTLVVARFLYLALRGEAQALGRARAHAHALTHVRADADAFWSPAVLVSWLAVLAGSLVAVWLVPVDFGVTLSKLGSATWPVALGALGAAFAWRFLAAPALPPGDVLVVVLAAVNVGIRGLETVANEWLPAARGRVTAAAASLRARSRVKGLLAAAEVRLGAWPVAAGLFVALVLALAAAAA